MSWGEMWLSTGCLPILSYPIFVLVHIGIRHPHGRCHCAGRCCPRSMYLPSIERPHCPCCCRLCATPTTRDARLGLPAPVLYRGLLLITCRVHALVRPRGPPARYRCAHRGGAVVPQARHHGAAVHQPAGGADGGRGPHPTAHLYQWRRGAHRGRCRRTAVRGRGGKGGFRRGSGRQTYLPHRCMGRPAPSPQCEVCVSELPLGVFPPWGLPAKSTPSGFLVACRCGTS